MIRPPIVVFSAGKAAVGAPADAADSFAWLVGLALREAHRRDPELGQCPACGSTAEHCQEWRTGWALMRASLADPGTVPDLPQPT